MGFRYRRSIRLARGIRINLSKSGPSLSIGQRGATMNFGPRGTRLTVGIPGIGLSYQTMTGRTGTIRTRTNPSVGVAGAHSRSQRLRWTLGGGVVAIVGLIALANGGSGSGTSQTAAVEVQETAAAPMQEAQLPKATVEAVGPANIRSDPRSDAKIVGQAERHQQYSVFGRLGGWTEVGTDHALGWVGNSRLIAKPD